MPGEPCAELHRNFAQRRIYRGYNDRKGLLTLPCFHQSRWRAALDLSPVDQIAALDRPNYDELFPPIPPTAIYDDLVMTIEAMKEAKRRAR